jgi:hypothetical protein
MSELNKNLEQRIEIFKKKFSKKNEILFYKPNKFDLYLDQSYNIIIKIFKKNLNNVILKSLIIKSSLFLKNSLSYLFNSIKKISNSLNLIVIKFNALEKKIEFQENLIKKSIDLNQKLSEKLEMFDEKISKFSVTNDEYNQQNKFSTLYSNKELAKLNILQEENLRISSELLDNRKKVEIMKNEIEKYNDQRSKFIKKINSVNEIINDSNVLTSVFNNDINNNQINVLDPNKTIENKTDINQEVQNIFSKKIK